MTSGHAFSFFDIPFVLAVVQGLSKAKHMPVLGVALLGAWIVCAVCIALYFAQLDRRDRQRMRQQARHYHEIAPS